MRLLLSLRQRSFARPSADAHLLDAWLQEPDVRIDPYGQAENRQDGMFYVFPELPETVDVALVKLAIRLADLQLRAAVYPTKKEIKKLPIFQSSLQQSTSQPTMCTKKCTL